MQSLALTGLMLLKDKGTAVIDGGQPGASAAGNGAGALTPKGGRLNNGRLSNTGLETSSSILAGALTLMSAFMVGRRKQNNKIISNLISLILSIP